MQVVVDAAGFSGAEADTLRRAMGSKRSPEKMARLRSRFYEGLEKTNGITGEIADRLWDKIVAFASYGFPESHAQSFASLVYYSAWFKHHYPAEFCVALLRAQPMGFYSPQSIIADARRHGVRILPVDINASKADPDTVVDAQKINAQDTVVDVRGGEGKEDAQKRGEHTQSRGTHSQGRGVRDHERDMHGRTRGVHGLGRGEGEPLGAIRLGLAQINGIGRDIAQSIVSARERLGEFHSIAELSREAGLTVAHVEQLGRAGALESLGLSRRSAVWAAGIAATERPGMLPNTSVISAPALPGMNAFELLAADLAATGITPDVHPVQLLRQYLDTWHERGSGGVPVVTSERLLQMPDGQRVRVAGVVTHRQRPATAGGVVFFGLEDETGLANVMVTEGLWKRQRKEALSAKLVVIRGIVHNREGAASVTADLIEPIEPRLLPARQIASAHGGARDFR